MTKRLDEGSPDVSVVMPVRDGGRFLATAIETIRGQSLGSIEIIVVDDASNDASGRIVRDIALKDGRVRYVRRERSEGIVAALGTGIRVARAPFIARMDADDVALPARLRLQRDFLAHHPEVVALGGQIEKIDAAGESLGAGRYPLGASACRDHLRYGSPFCHPAVMLRAKALREAGGYSARYASAEDYDLWLRMARIGELNNLPQTILRYRVHGSSLTATRAKAMAVDTAVAYLEAFHSPETKGWRPDEGAETDWPAVEERMPANLRMAGRFAYLRALALNGGIVGPAEERLLARSIAPLSREARRRGEAAVLCFTLLRAARQFARAGRPGMAARLLGRALLLDAPQVARTLRSNAWSRRRTPSARASD